MLDILLNMNEILYSFNKMNMNKKVRTTATSTTVTNSCNSKKTCHILHTPTIPIANAQNQLVDPKAKDLKKFLKLLKKHVKKQIILKKTKILV